MVIFTAIYNALDLQHELENYFKFQLYVELRNEIEDVELTDERIDEFYNAYLIVQSLFNGDFYSISDFVDFMFWRCEDKQCSLVDIDLKEILKEFNDDN